MLQCQKSCRVLKPPACPGRPNLSAPGWCHLLASSNGLVSLVGPTVQHWPLDICSFASTDFQLRLDGMVLSWLDLSCQSLDLTPGFDAKRNLTAITTQQNN